MNIFLTVTLILALMLSLAANWALLQACVYSREVAEGWRLQSIELRSELNQALEKQRSL